MSDYTLFSEVKRRARKSHRCIWCGQSIVAGESYLDERSIYDGQIQRHRWHPECRAAAAEYFKSGEEEFTPGDNERPPSREDLAPELTVSEGADPMHTVIMGKTLGGEPCAWPACDCTACFDDANGDREFCKGRFPGGRNAGKPVVPSPEPISKATLEKNQPT